MTIKSRSVEDWEADPGQGAALDAARREGPTQPSAAAVILAEMRGEQRPEPVPTTDSCVSA